MHDYKTKIILELILNNLVIVESQYFKNKRVPVIKFKKITTNKMSFHD